ncbi:T9SS type A sorting domain-containing protein [Reichenbachiella sp.]|uniref:T9SS type A sorting domain-containing protein n=1 Tax=Reichenbachiella sp. TaxID=2184521 RepID=UPI003B5BD9B7
MRIILLSANLLFASLLFAQNPKNPPAPDTDGDTSSALYDQFSIEHLPVGQSADQRIAAFNQSANNENARLIYDSLIWEIYNEERDVWELNSVYKYMRDADGNVTSWLYQLYDTETQAWLNKGKYEKTYNDDGLETSYVRSTWDEGTSAWAFERKILQEYNDSQVRTLHVAYDWNEEYEDWEGDFKLTREFNDSGDLTVEENYNDWDWDTKLWIGDYRFLADYDETGLRQSETSSNWNILSSDWDNTFKVEFVYNEKHLKIEQNHFYWNVGIDDWADNGSYEYEYDESNRNSLTIQYLAGGDYIEKIETSFPNDNVRKINFYEWSEGSWIKVKRQEVLDSETSYDDKIYRYDENSDEYIWSSIEYTYNEDKNILLELNKYWDPSTEKLVNSSKYVLDYTDDGRYTKYERFDWDTENEAWAGMISWYYNYDERGKWVEEQHFSGWNSNTNSWIGEERNTYEVNDHDKRLSRNYYDWVDGGWKHTYRATYYHHLDCSSSSTPVHNYLTLEDQTELCSVESLVAPTAIGCGGDLTATTDAEFPIEAVGTTEVTWIYDDGNGNTSTQTQKVIIDQSCQPLSVELNKLVEVYPNPSLGQINFKQKIDEVEVFNQTGQLEMKIHSPGSSINVSKLKAGIYYLTLKYQTNTARVKIIKN